jgi:hypothetical protein
MIVYNLTMKVDHLIHDKWLQWQKEEYIPGVIATKQFTDYKFFRLLDQDETDGATYVLQFFAPDIDHYQKYIEIYSSSFRQKIVAKWGTHCLTFNTVMTIVP